MRAKLYVVLVLGLMATTASCGRQKEGVNSDEAQAPAAASIGAQDTGRALTVDALEADSTLGWLRTLKEQYPDQYRAYGVKVDEVLGKNPSLVSARVELNADIQPFMAARKLQLSQTPDAELVEYLRRNTTVVERLANEDVQACTDAFHGNLRPDIQLPDATWKAMSDTTSQLLVAARAADANPTVREGVPLTPEDFSAWRREMVQVGATKGTFEILASPARKAAATASEKCQIRLIMMKAALQLPVPLAAKVALNLVSPISAVPRV